MKVRWLTDINVQVWLQKPTMTIKFYPKAKFTTSWLHLRCNSQYTDCILLRKWHSAQHFLSHPIIRNSYKQLLIFSIHYSCTFKVWRKQWKKREIREWKLQTNGRRTGRRGRWQVFFVQIMHITVLLFFEFFKYAQIVKKCSLVCINYTRQFVR